MSDILRWALVNSGDKHVPEIEGRGKLSSKVVWSIALVALAACATNKSPYVIGAAGPWKQGYGLQNLQGVQLAVEEINQAGGIDGHPLRVIPRDDEGDGPTAAKIAQDFVATSSISAALRSTPEKPMASKPKPRHSERIRAFNCASPMPFGSTSDVIEPSYSHVTR